jgi:DivIVA domain-containing protein
MATALIYVLVLLAVAAVIFVGASALFGRGEELAPIPKGASPTWLPDTAMAGADVRAVRFQQAVRGYRMSEVDWVLDQVAGELERLHLRIAELEHSQEKANPTEPEPATDEPTQEHTEA